MHVLHTDGGVELPLRPAAGADSADTAIGRRTLPYVDSVALPPKELGAERHNAFLIPPEKEFSWFSRVVARAHAAGQLSLAGGGGTVGQFLIDEQGRKHFSETAYAGTASVHDAKVCFAGEQYVGTDQVFRVNGTRVEAFSGMAADLYALLAKGKVEEYRRRTYERRNDWPEPDDIDDWGCEFHPAGRHRTRDKGGAGAGIVRRPFPTLIRPKESPGGEAGSCRSVPTRAGPAPPLRRWAEWPDAIPPAQPRLSHSTAYVPKSLDRPASAYAKARSGTCTTGGIAVDTHCDHRR